MGKMDDFEPLPVEDNPSGTPADKPTITDRPVRKPRTRLTSGWQRSPACMMVI